jgi:hypothetical protein
VRIRGYFTNPEGVREQKGLGNTFIVDVLVHVMTFNGVTSVACRQVASVFHTDATVGCVTDELKFSQLLIIKNDQS